MRNLLGRLHARPAADIDRIAAWWRVPLGGGGGTGDRGGGIGLLYRWMTDPIAARDAWARLAADEAALVRALVDDPDHGATVPEIAAALRCDPAAARDVAIRLYRTGLLAREGDEAELPLGELPRLFLPRELALLFRRVLDEIDLGDRSATPLRALVEWLDDGEIEDAAEAWGVPAAPGARQRGEVTRRLLRHAADPERIARVVATLPRDARRLWEAVLTAGGEGSIPLSAALEAADLAADDPPGSARRRAALETLERRLLVLPTYGADGQRLLFVPPEILSPSPPPAPPLPPAEPLPDDAVPDHPARHPDALAWDLMTLLRDVAAGGWPAHGSPPRGRLRGLNRRLWLRGPDSPPTGYVSFLLALAAAEGLVAEDDGDPPTLRLGANGRAWRDMSFPDQTRRLRDRWLAFPDRVEAAGRGDVSVWGVDWRSARARLLALLGDPLVGLTDGVWLPLDAVAARIAAHDPDLLGPAFTAATARLGVEAAYGSDEDARAAATAEVVGGALATAFDWFGLVETASAPARRQRAVRLTGFGRVAAGGGSLPAPRHEGAGDGPPLAVAADGLIRLLRPSPLRIWVLSAFAEQEALGPEPTYRLSEAALARAINAGFDLERVVSFLARQAGDPLPAELEAQVRAWARGVRRVRARRGLLLVPDDPTDRGAVTTAAREHGWTAEPHGDGVLVLVPADLPDPDEAVLAALRAAGLSPRLADRATSPFPSPSPSPPRSPR
jgi:hypothetical protein